MCPKTTRRHFLNQIKCSVLLTPFIYTCRKVSKQPNILIILTDQQHANMMSCAGNSYLKTPAMDSLAQNGIRFERAYCTDPVCVPSRFSLMTGRMPSEIKLRSNNRRHINAIPKYIKDNGLGWLFKGAGYKVAYGGKEHFPKMRATDLGFEYICKDEREELARTCADFINQEHLVSNGLDMLPTLCDFAGIPVPSDLKGSSLRALTESDQTKPWRSYLPVESQIGRMVVTRRYKYIVYDKVGTEEQLLDLEKYPGETCNAAKDFDNQSVLAEHREIYKKHFS